MSTSTTITLLLLPSLPHRNRTLTSNFVSPISFSVLKRSPLLRRSFPTTRSPPRLAPVVAAQSNLLKVIQTAWRIGKDGIEAGTNIVPDTIPRPIARICVAGVAVTVALFLLKSFLSTAFFVLAMMGFIYFVFIALNKEEGTRGGGSTASTEEESLEEARRIMDKYK